MANRRVFERRLQRLASEALRYERPVGMLVIDVDRFKLVNDGNGHPVGDEVLGGACIPGHALHADELERLADRSLYNAKEAGRDLVDVGGRSAPQRRIPVSETGIVAQLEVLADRLDGAQSSQEHSLAMVDVAHRLCNALGVSVAQRRRCLAAARLHDIGKIGTPSHILTKPGSLNTAEVAVMQDHVRVGVELLNALPETQEFAAIVAQHHELFDGTGYPAGLAGELISIEARIIAAADA